MVVSNSRIRAQGDVRSPGGAIARASNNRNGFAMWCLSDCHLQGALVLPTFSRFFRAAPALYLCLPFGSIAWVHILCALGARAAWSCGWMCLRFLLSCQPC
jgi:hypothetical protein